MKNIIALLVTFLVCATLLCGYFAFSKKSSPPPIIVKPNKSDNVESPKDVLLNILPEYIIPSEGIRLRSDILLTDTTLKKLSMGQVVGHGKLIFRFSHMDCDMCVDFVTKAMVEILGQSSLSPILIVDGLSDHEFVLWARTKSFPFKIYSLPRNGIESNTLGLAMENKQLPFLFELNQNLITSKVFCPFREYEEYTKKYLRYFSRM